MYYMVCSHAVYTYALSTARSQAYLTYKLFCWPHIQCHTHVGLRLHTVSQKHSTKTFARCFRAVSFQRLFLPASCNRRLYRCTNLAKSNNRSTAFVRRSLHV